MIPLKMRRLFFGFTSRRLLGINGSILAHCPSLNQNKFARICWPPIRLGRMGRERVSQTRREPRMRFTERRFPKGPADVPVEVPVPVVPDCTGAGAACGAGVMAWERGAGAGERGRGVR